MLKRSWRAVRLRSILAVGQLTLSCLSPPLPPTNIFPLYHKMSDPSEGNGINTTNKTTSGRDCTREPNRYSEKMATISCHRRSALRVHRRMHHIIHSYIFSILSAGWLSRRRLIRHRLWQRVLNVATHLDEVVVLQVMSIERQGKTTRNISPSPTSSVVLK